MASDSIDWQSRAIWNRFSVLAVAIAISACGVSEDVSRAAQSSANCVPLPEGQYTFQNGVFVPNGSNVPTFSAGDDDPSELPADTSATTSTAGDTWTTSITETFAGLGYDWLGVNVRGRNVVLTGTAPSSVIKEAAFVAGRSVVLENALPDQTIDLVVDAISIEDGASGVGLAVLGLQEEPSLEACRAAFRTTIAIEDVEFRTGSAVIQPESSRLLDAIAAVANTCGEFEVEIGGHTNNIGEDLENLRLSQRRAEAVLSELTERGTSEDRLMAVGYGETLPLDQSGSREANAINQRTEFTVRRRPQQR